MGGGGDSGGGGGGGVEDLLPIIKKSGDKDAQISEFKGRAVGVDVPVWLHKGPGLSEAARQALQKLRIPVAAAVPGVGKPMQCLKNAEVTPVFVADGSNNPTKPIEDARRQAKADAAFLELRARRSLPVPAGDAAYHTKLRKFGEEAGARAEANDERLAHFFVHQIHISEANITGGLALVSQFLYSCAGASGGGCEGWVLMDP